MLNTKTYDLIWGIKRPGKVLEEGFIYSLIECSILDSNLSNLPLKGPRMLADYCGFALGFLIIWVTTFVLGFLLDF